MKPVHFVSLVLIVLLSGCLPAAPKASAPQPDLQATAAGMAATMAAETIQALPTSTPVPPTATPTPLPPPGEPNTPTLDPLLAILTVVPTLGTVTVNTPAPTESEPWNCDKIPSSVERGSVTIENFTHNSIYVSLYGLTKQEYHVCIGLELRHATTIDLPLGNYSYYIVVGGNELRGSFSYTTAHKMVISVTKDRVAIH